MEARPIGEHKDKSGARRIILTAPPFAGFAFWPQESEGEAGAPVRDRAAEVPGSSGRRYRRADDVAAPTGPADRRRRAWRDILVYGVASGLLITVLKLTEYRFLVIEHSFEIYAGIVAVLFAGSGSRSA